MKYFDSKKNVFEYIKMARGYDGKELIKKLRIYLPDGATLLELGMGPGKDLDILKKWYTSTGSDNSSIFLELYKKRNPRAQLLHLDAVTIDTKSRFQCIYSNKVLHHLTKADLKRSLLRQKEVLKKGGIVFHSFWNGNKQERYSGLLFVYYRIEQLVKMFGQAFDILEVGVYRELKKEDSIYIIARKR